MTRTRTTLLALAALLTLGGHTRPADAEGSRDLYPSGYNASGARANLEWTTDGFGGGANPLKSRTVIHVYVNAGENILVGSSAVGVGSGDVFIYAPSQVSGGIGTETFTGAAVFHALQQSNTGKITSRTLELAGPQSVSNPSGWAPAVYTATQPGLYAVVFYGPSGDTGTAGSPTGSVGTVDASTGQGTTVSAWDVTVRDPSSPDTDIDGRVFAYYLALNAGDNGRHIYSTVYACTTDGYRYQIDLGGLDPWRFRMYGNQVGFFDSDGVTPLYHDVVGSDGQLTTIQGSCKLAPPSYPMFLNLPDDLALGAAGVSTMPITPSISGLSFAGTAGSNNSHVGTGGTFSFNSNISAVYDIVISRDGVNFDPTLPANRRLRGVRASGPNTVAWDGKDNNGNNFPVGTGYAFKGTIHGGEYHFPMVDAENNFYGGPAVTLLNATNPLGVAPNSSFGNTVGFYDDRGYRTVGGSYVTSDGTSNTVGQVLGGLSPPATAFSDAVKGFNTATSQRAYGVSSGGNTNVTNTGSFGDTKGLDQWTFFPSPVSSSTLNVQGTPDVLLVKRITAVNGVPVSGFVDDPNTTTDNSAYWPTPASTYLRGALSGTTVKPGDTVEYTIYFVDTGGPATNVLLCDPLPANMTFVPDTYTGQTPGDGGTAGAPSGIALGLSASTLPTAPTNFLSNAADAPDRGQFYPPGTQAPAAANPASGYTAPLPAASNLAGVVAVDVAPSPATLPSATGAGTPTGSYGFIRFSARVN